MKTTTETTHIFELEETERFAWTKTSGPYSGNAFIVDTVKLEHRRFGPQVYLRGEWVKRPEGVEERHERTGWEYLFEGVEEDQRTIRTLPPVILDALLFHGLEAPEGGE